MHLDALGLFTIIFLKRANFYYEKKENLNYDKTRELLTQLKMMKIIVGKKS